MLIDFLVKHGHILCGEYKAIDIKKGIVYRYYYNDGDINEDAKVSIEIESAQSERFLIVIVDENPTDFTLLDELKLNKNGMPLKNEPRCDLAVAYYKITGNNKRVLCFVELKGRNKAYGKKQLANTISRFISYFKSKGFDLERNYKIKVAIVYIPRSPMTTARRKAILDEEEYILEDKFLLKKIFGKAKDNDIGEFIRNP